ncbi:PA14 domain-containing protein, partial [Deinococcus sp.]|uniref:PA14 domain-containing protein n=1 Tax=Deinococcus sp. TaxID=47478 RepID=UPI00286E3B83
PPPRPPPSRPLRPRAPDAASPQASAGAAQRPTGLYAAYYATRDRSGPATLRAVQEVNFDWGKGAPLDGIPAGNFSLRLSGELSAPVSATYTFYVAADDGMRLEVAGQKVVNGLSDHAAYTATGTLDLKAGASVPLRLDHHENTGLASLKLEWSGPNLLRQVIPASALFTGACLPPSPSGPDRQKPPRRARWQRRRPRQRGAAMDHAGLSGKDASTRRCWSRTVPTPACTSSAPASRANPSRSESPRGRNLTSSPPRSTAPAFCWGARRISISAASTSTTGRGKRDW